MSDLLGRAAALVEMERSRPLSLTAGECDDGAARLELTSRGDRVPARLWLPDSQAAAPAVGLQYGLRGAVDRSHDLLARSLAAAGVAVFTVDWPLHGRRASVKLSERLEVALDADESDRNTEALVLQFVLQSVLDLSRCLDALSAHAAVDPGRLTLVGWGLGASLVAHLAAVDPRPSALVLAPQARETKRAALALGPLLEACGSRPVHFLAGSGRSDPASDEIQALRGHCTGESSVATLSGEIASFCDSAAATLSDLLDASSP